MHLRVNATAATIALLCLIPAAGLALAPYNQDFESMQVPAPGGLLGDGWLVYGNVFNPGGTYLYGYGPFPAPNDGAAFCAIATDQGGPEQGQKQLSVYSDYNNTDHGAGNTIESNVFQEQVITAGDVGNIWSFEFHAKLGNLGGSSIAKAFIKTLNPAAGYAITNFITADMTAIPATWSGYAVSIEVTAGLVGQILQFGFMNTATLYQPSGVFYDNVRFHLGTPTGVPSNAATSRALLRQNFPNPFNPSTRIDFSLQNTGPVEIAVFDVGGRRIAILHEGTLEAGEHHVVWDGRCDNGRPAAAGHYRYVLKTASSRIARSMVLVK